VARGRFVGRELTRWAAVWADGLGSALFWCWVFPVLAGSWEPDQGLIREMVSVPWRAVYFR